MNDCLFVNIFAYCCFKYLTIVCLQRLLALNRNQILKSLLSIIFCQISIHQFLARLNFLLCGINAIE